ncbi:hypothetical protein GTB64_004550 [Salmonella enterica]|nr:hypothetical protein [Salmonella enterica]
MIDIEAVMEAAEKYEAALAATKADPHDSAKLTAFSSASAAFNHLIQNDAMGIICLLRNELLAREEVDPMGLASHSPHLAG